MINRSVEPNSCAQRSSPTTRRQRVNDIGNFALSTPGASSYHRADEIIISSGTDVWLSNTIANSSRQSISDFTDFDDFVTLLHMHHQPSTHHTFSEAAIDRQHATARN
jgi:hypothetical protein